MRVLVTGAGGFIGRPAVRGLRRSGHEVYALLRSAPAGAEHWPDGVHFIRGDLDRVGDVRAALDASRPEATLHLAWYADPADYLHAAWENLAALERTFCLLRCLREASCRRVVLGGTCLEHATGSPAAASAYATAKRAAHDVALGLPADDLSVACAHVFWVYGPGEHPRRGIPSVVRSVLRGEPLAVTAGTQLREYLHVDDVASALAAVVASDVTGRVDIATGASVPLRAVFEQVQRAAGGKDVLHWGARPSGPDDSFEVPSDPGVLRALGTWAPHHSLETGIADTVRWWREKMEDDEVVRS